MKIGALRDTVEKWRDACHNPIGTKFPTQEQLKAKMDTIHKLAVEMHMGFMDTFERVVPYIHHALHTGQWQYADLWARSGKAMEGKGKEIKQTKGNTNGKIEVVQGKKQEEQPGSRCAQAAGYDGDR